MLFRSDNVVFASYHEWNATGFVWIFAGSADGLAPSPVASLHGEDVFYSFGASVAGGDANGDGYADVLVGAPQYDSYTGCAYLYAGSASGLESDPVLVAEAPSGGWYGGVVALAGDANGDGLADPAVAAPSANGRGCTYVMLGASGWPDGSEQDEVCGPGASYTGTTLAWVGDVNSDGFDDLLAGAPGYDASSGRAYLYMGSSDGIETRTSATLRTSVDEDQLGASLAGAGDVDADGYDDVVVGVPYANTYEGAALVYQGHPDGLIGRPSTSLAGAGQLTWFGDAVAGAGDVDGDGFSDVLVGAWDRGRGGQAQLYRGYAVGDSDGDGYGDGSFLDDSILACPGDDGTTDGRGDCDDTDAAIHPEAEETCDAGNVDEDCNELADDADEDASGKTTWYADADGDGARNPAESLEACDRPAGYVAAGEDDCDDTDSDVHPGATEVADDDVDQDCDGQDLTSPETPETRPRETGCGCATAPGPGDGALFGLGLLALAGWGRRRGSDAMKWNSFRRRRGRGSDRERPP